MLTNTYALSGDQNQIASGWGLASSQSSENLEETNEIFASDGSSTIYKLDPTSFSIIEEI